jgi:hypothetical protein
MEGFLNQRHATHGLLWAPNLAAEMPLPGVNSLTYKLRANGAPEYPNRDTLCDTLVLGVLRAYKDLGSHRGLVSCCKAYRWVYGMEEVVGSIPNRSTKKLNNLANRQEKRDTRSIRWFSRCIVRSVFCDLARTIQQNIHHPALRLTFGGRQGLCVDVHRCGDIGMAHEFLHHLDVLAVRL